MASKIGGPRIIESTVRTTFLKNGKVIDFVGGKAKVSEEEARELMSRPGNLYKDNTTKRGGIIDDGKGSMDRLELEYGRLFNEKRLPELKKWLFSKASEIEPALLGMQQRGELPEIEPEEPEESTDDDTEEDNEDGENETIDENEVDLGDVISVNVEAKTIETPDGTFTINNVPLLKKIRKRLRVKKKSGKKKSNKNK